MSNTLLVPGHKLCEYRLTLPLSERLRQKVVQLQRNMHDKYRLPISTELPPSILLLRCETFEGLEEKLAERLSSMAIRNESFTVNLQGFVAPDTQSISLGVAPNNGLYELIKEVSVLRSFLKTPASEPKICLTPEVALASKLKPFQFTRMWMDCELMPFSGQFTANRMELLKQAQSGADFQLLQHFDLAALSMRIKQGSLFN